MSADNSSLNQVLGEIARQTGMKITGSVSDERVYGQYGPSKPAAILVSLLEGTSSNMLLRGRAGKAPTELVLTPRLGGPTAANPNAAAAAESNGLGVGRGTSVAPGVSMPASAAPAPAVALAGQVWPALAGNGLSVPVQGAASSTSVGVQIDAAPAQTNAGAVTGGVQISGVAYAQSPNGVGTPQQIDQVLLQLQTRQPVNP